MDFFVLSKPLKPKIMVLMLFIILIVAGICLYDFIDSKNWQSATSTSRNTVIFENRNKKYGAYNLRSDYNDSFGMILGIFVASLLIISIVNKSLGSTAITLEVPVMYTDTTVLHIVAPPVEKIETIETPYKITGKSSGGAGSPSNDPVIKTPKEQSQKISTQKLSDHSPVSGESNKTNGVNAINKPSTMVKAENPFGIGGATKGTKAGIFGTDIGIAGPDDNSTFGGGTIKRKKLTSLNSEDLESNTPCIVHVKVFINAEGTVVRAENNGKLTTTTNSVLISKVIALVKEQIRYNKIPGAALQTDQFSVMVNAR